MPMKRSKPWYYPYQSAEEYKQVRNRIWAKDWEDESQMWKLSGPDVEKAEETETSNIVKN